MRKLRFAFGSIGREKMFLGHLGASKFFLVYDLYEDGRCELVDRRENVSPKERFHGDPAKMYAVIEILKDCDLFVGGIESPNFRRLAKNTEYQPVVCKARTLDELIEKLRGSFDLLYSLVERRKKGERMEEVPVL